MGALASAPLLESQFLLPWSVQQDRSPFSVMAIIASIGLIIASGISISQSHVGLTGMTGMEMSARNFDIDDLCN